MRLLSLLIGLMGVFATNTSSPTISRTHAISSTPTATRTWTMTATRSRVISPTTTATRSRVISPTATSTRTRTMTATGSAGSSTTATHTGTLSGTLTGTNTMTATLTQTGTQSLTSTKLQMAVAPSTTTETPSTTYIAIGSIGGCLVLMTIVAVAIVVNNRPRKKLHYAPTMMNVPIPQYDNPVSSRILFAPTQTRGLTTMTD